MSKITFQTWFIRQLLWEGATNLTFSYSLASYRILAKYWTSVCKLWALFVLGGRLFSIKIPVWNSRRTEFINFALQLDRYLRTVFCNQFQLICKHCIFHYRWNSGNNEEKWLKRHKSAFQASRTRDADNPQIQEVVITSLSPSGNRHEENWTQSCHLVKTEVNAICTLLMAGTYSYK